MKYVIDIQALKQPHNEFVVKEMAIHRIGSIEAPNVYFFKSPFAWSELPAKYKAENGWLTRNYHHIAWDYGEYPYSSIAAILKFDLVECEQIYVKGLEKQKWLGQFVPNVQNVENIQNTTSLKNMREWKQRSNVCKFHKESKSHCAAQNALLIERFVTMNNPSFERSFEVFNELKNLQLMTADDLEYLPKYFITNYAAESVDAAWDKLPSRLKNDFEILMCLKCRIHDHSDKRVIPMVKNCEYCIAKNVEIDL